MRFAIAIFAILFMPLACLAAEETRPRGEVILTVSGLIANTNDSDRFVYDRAMLQALPVTSFSTTTNWTEGERTFTGVLLSDLLAALDASGSRLRATALNDYAVEIPASDARPGGPIIAYAIDGEPMSVRDKGPLWIVYPYDSQAEYRTETIYSRSIWQLDRVEVFD